jgi:hypothetical protein
VAQAIELRQGGALFLRPFIHGAFHDTEHRPARGPDPLRLTGGAQYSTLCAVERKA